MGIVLAVVAIALPVIGLAIYEKRPLKRPFVFTALSFASCCGVFLMQMSSIKEEVFAGQIGTVEDTIGALIMIGAVVAAVTVIANFILLAVYSMDKE